MKVELRILPRHVRAHELRDAYDRGRRDGYVAGFAAGAEHERTEGSELRSSDGTPVGWELMVCHLPHHEDGPCSGLPRPDCPGYDAWHRSFERTETTPR